VSFDEALTVFADPLARIFDDEEHSVDEHREIIVGHSAGVRLLWSASRPARIEYGSSVYARPRNANGDTMKKASNRNLPPPVPDEIRAEYQFDYSESRPNRFAARMKGSTVAVVLDPDVASVFQTSEAVNSLLRSVISALPENAKRDSKRD